MQLDLEIVRLWDSENINLNININMILNSYIFISLQ